MKKSEKTAKKANSAKKTSQNSRKKGSKSAKRHKKRFITVHFAGRRSDALRAFLLVGVLIAFSGLISFAIVKIRSSLRNPPEVSVTMSEKAPEAIVPDTLPEAAPDVATVTAPDTVRHTVPAAAPQKIPEKAPVQVPQRVPERVSVTPASTVTPANASQTERNTASLGTLVFIIDDAGNNLRELEPFLSIPGPLTIAVLPGLPHSAEAARRIRAAGKEVFLHQPMEALGAQNPGPGAIYSGMGAEEIRAILKRNLVEVGPVAGINNHQGSKITQDSEAVKTILAFCAEQGLVFLDSRTTAETVVPLEARRVGMKIGERDVFIDNEQDKESMLKFITGGLGKARQNGSAVMIGHTWSPELAPLLAEQYPRLTRQGYTMKSASALIKSK